MENNGEPMDVPLGQPRFRYDDLTDQNSIYDRLEAAPSDGDLKIMWILLGVVNVVVSLATGTVIVAIAIHKMVRQKPFNLYLAGLLFPDFLFSFCCLFTCFLSVARGHYASEEMCQFQAVYLLFGFTANAWLNAAVAWEVYTLLRSSNIRKRYQPPKKRKVFLTIFLVYFWSSFIATLTFYVSHLKVGTYFGVFCFASSSDLEGDLFFWLFGATLALIVPYIVVFWIFLDTVFLRKTLPPRGKRREITIYFFRIFFVCLFMWMPCIVLVIIGRGRVHPWISWASAMWAHTQGFVNSLFACLKEDIATAVKNLWGCGLCGKREEGQERRSRLDMRSFLSAAYASRLSRTHAPSSIQDSPAGGETTMEEEDNEIAHQGDDYQFSDEEDEPVDPENENEHGYEENLMRNVPKSEQLQDEETSSALFVDSRR